MQLTSNIYLVGSGEIGLSDGGDCHVYLVDGGSELALIDAGCGSEDSHAALLSNIESHGLDLKKLTSIILTHSHSDHARGAHLFRDKGCRIFAPEDERGFIEAGWDGLAACNVDVGVNHHDRIRVGTLELTALTVPSHSEASTAYLLATPNHRSLFVGDILFFNGVIGLINHPGSELSNYRKYIERLGELKIDALLPAHSLFTLAGGQKHIDLAIRNVTTDPFVPSSIGQLGISFRRPGDY